MKKSDQLKLERTAKVEAQGAMITKSKAENRDFTPEEQTQFDTLDSEIENLERSIKSAERVEVAELRAAAIDGTPVATTESRSEEKETASIHRLIRSAMVNGNVTLNETERSVVATAKAAAQRSSVATNGVVIPLNRASQTVTGNSGANGAELVPTDLQSPIDFLRPAPLMGTLGAQRLTNLTGNVKFPVNEGGIVASWEGETATTSETANVYGSVEMSPKRLSVTVPISLQQLYQTSFDMEMYTINQINLAIGNAIDAAAINGSGSGNIPLGLLNNTDVNTVASGTNGSAPTWDNIVDLETKVFVENANAAKMAYIVNPQTRGKLKKTKHEAGDFNYIMGTTGDVNGYGSQTTNHLPANLTKGTGSNLSAMAFGDFTQMLIGEWGFMDLSVDEFSRKKEGLVEVTVNVFADVLVKQPKAFSVIKGLITT